MPKDILQLLDVATPPVANSTGTTVFTIPDNVRLHGVELKGVVSAAQMVTGFGDVRLKLGGKTQRVATMQEIDEVQSLYGLNYGVQNDIPAGPFLLPVEFSQWWRKQYAAAEGYALDVPAGRDVQIEVDSNSLATAPTIVARAEMENLGDIQQRGGALNPWLVKWYRRGNIAVAGTSVDINDMTKRDLYQLIRLYDPTGAVISDVQVTIDGKLRFNCTKAENDVWLTRKGMYPQAGCFDIVPDASDNPVDAWDLRNASKFEIHVNFSASATGAVKVLSHRFGPPD